MKHLQISAKAIGDATTAVSELLKLVKIYGADIYLDFPEGFNICVKPTSDIQDLLLIYKLERRLLTSHLDDTQKCRIRKKP